MSIVAISWWTLQDSNLQPTGYEPVALTIELRVRELHYILVWTNPQSIKK
jgi:hypothetical protein